MASARAALISTILPPLADLAMQKVKAMVVDKVKGNVNIESDISNLQTTLGMIQDIVQVAEEKQINYVFIQNWLRDLVDIAYEARDVLDDFITFSSCTVTAEEASKPVNIISSLMLTCFCHSSRDTSNIPLPILHRLANDIRSLREIFDKKKNDGETFTKLKSVVGGGGSESVRVDGPEVGPSINRDALFLGREDVKEKIMEKILHPRHEHVDVVVIWGMGGIGKTTLAQSIYNDERVKENFCLGIGKSISWSCVGVNKFSAKKVISEMVDDQNTKAGIGNLQEKLVEKFCGKRFLIVLDDVWDVGGSEWDLLFNPLTEVGNGGLIIITTRKREVCTATKTQTTYDLKPLSEDDSWRIFQSCAFIYENADFTPDLKCIGKKIVKNLKGLPLALKVVGCYLLYKDSSIWTNFLESNEWTLKKDNEVMPELRRSYNHLPPHLKICFTYCALFPKGHVWENEKVLVEMWMAHDLIQKEEQKRPEDVGAQYFDQLANASLLQCVDGKYVMHDLIHDLALLVSNGEFASTNSSLTNDEMKKVRHITRTEDDYLKIPHLFKIEKLLTLYIIWTYDTNRCDDVFKQMKSIRVLVLDSSKITDIPDCISELRHLRYLDVSRTRVKRLPDSLCHLYNLQMIAAQHHVVLPRDVVKMVNLRYIRANLSTCKGVGKLTSLQELSSIHVCQGDNIRELGAVQRLCGKLRIKGLENVTSKEDAAGALMEKQTLMDELVLEFNQHLEESTISKEVLDALKCPPNLTYLLIAGYNGFKPPSWMVDEKRKFDKLQTLELSFCLNLESLPPLGELTYLKYLLLMNVGVKRLGDEFYGKFTDGKVFFPSLELLRFSYMEEWEEWNDIIIENSSMSFFPCLTRLEIDHCSKLLSVLPVVRNPIMNAANFMTSLSCLEIRYCKKLRSLPADGFPPSLKDLRIVDCLLLYERCKDESGADWHKVNHIPDKDIRFH